MKLLEIELFLAENITNLVYWFSSHTPESVKDSIRFKIEFSLRDFYADRINSCFNWTMDLKDKLKND